MKGLSVTNVTKRFGDITALDRINLYFGENRIWPAWQERSGENHAAQHYHRQNLCRRRQRHP